MVEDKLSLAEISTTLSKKRALVAEALQQRHVTKYTHAEIRLQNVADWTYRLMSKIRKEKGKETVKAEFKGFFNYEFTAEQKEACKVFIRNDEEVSILIQDALASGYKFSMNYNARNDNYQVSMQCMDASLSNAGLVMSAFAKHWYDALAVLVYKHYIALETVWQNNAPPVDEAFG